MVKIPVSQTRYSFSTMTLSLPPSIAAYFDFSNGGDAADIADLFTRDAVVLDERQTHQGYDAIQSWRRDARTKFDYTVTPASVSRKGDRVEVVATVAGNFDGSPVQLNHTFELVDGKIRSLEIR